VTEKNKRIKCKVSAPASAAYCTSRDFFAVPKLIVCQRTSEQHVFIKLKLEGCIDDERQFVQNGQALIIFIDGILAVFNGVI